MHLLEIAGPIFLASCLSFGTAFLLDYLKTRRESRKLTRERLEKELGLLSGVNASIAFNIEVLIHTVMQQILPHYEASNAACSIIESLQEDLSQLKWLDDQIRTRFAPAIRRCPEPYLEEINLPRDLPFLITKESRLIALSGWINNYSNNLKSNLSERNRLIDISTVERAQEGLDFEEVSRTITTQASISEAEIVNAHQLLSALHKASQKIEVVIKTYKDVSGPKSRVEPPPIFVPLMNRLEEIIRSTGIDMPPPEPPAH